MGRRRRGHGDLEREILDTLAAATAPLTAVEVCRALDAALAVTTVATVLHRLHDKGQVTRRATGRAYFYTLVREHAQVTAWQMTRLLDADTDREGVLSSFVDALSDADEALLFDLLGRTENGPR